MSGLGKILEEMLIPNKYVYWDNISFEAGLHSYDRYLSLYLNTYGDCNSKYLKSHSRMNVAKLKEKVKEILSLNYPKIEMGKVIIDKYHNQAYRTATLQYKVDQELIDKLIVLEAIKISGPKVE